MKILFIARATLYSDPGGDTVQLRETAAHLIKAGVQVSIRLTHEKGGYDGYDLLHFFNIIRPADILRHTTRTDKPYVVSTIFVDYSEFEKTAREGMSGMVLKVFNADQIEYVKAMARWVKNGEAPGSLRYLLTGHKSSVRYVIRHSQALLPNSESEYRRVSEHFSITHRHFTIPNAVNQDLFVQPTIAPVRDPHLIICVGRMEGRKNQLNLIRAVKNTPFHLKLIGAWSVNQAAYVKACRDEAGANVEFVDSMPQKDLLNLYSTAKVHVLPSWFETTGLSSLEAGVMGCQLVITDKGDTREYFGDDAFYCDPRNPESIQSALYAASAAPGSRVLSDRINALYNWDRAAALTLEAYQKVLSGSNA